MRYIRVRWHHDSCDEPIELLSELDDDSWEVRKVEVFADGHVEFAGRGERSGLTGLGEVPIPSIEEIASDHQFSPEEITKTEFESVWEAARSVGHPL